MLWNEQSLLIKAINGNEKAFETIMKNYLNDIYNYISFKISKKEDIEDLIQEVMLGAYQSIHKFEKHSSIKTWLMSITRRKIADYYRQKYSKSNLDTVPISDNEQFVKEENISKLSKMSILEAIENLPQEEKDLVHLVFIQQLSYKEIEEVMDIPIGTIKSRMHHIKTKLKNLFEDDWRTLHD